MRLFHSISRVTCGALAAICVALVLAGAAASHAQEALTLEDRRLFADGLFSRELYARAAVEYGALAKSFPKMDEMDVVLFRWAEALRLSGDAQAADRALLQLIREHPKSAYLLKSQFQRGALAIQQKQYAAADELLEVVLKNNPPAEILEQALYYRAVALEESGSHTAAVRLLDELLRKFPRGEMAPYAQLSLGRRLLASKETNVEKRGREMLRASAATAPTPEMGAEALYVLAQSDFAQGRYKESATEFSELIQRYPQSEHAAAARRQAAWSSHNAGLFAEALGIAEKVLASGETRDRDEWLYLQGASEFQLANYGNALTSFASLAQSYPRSRYAGAAQFQTAVAHQKLGDPRAAVVAAERVAADDPQRKHVLWLLAECYGGLRDDDRAVQYYRLLATEFPKDERAPDALYQLGFALQKQEKWPDAAAAYLKLADDFSKNKLAPLALFAAGFCQTKSGENAKAIRDWERLLKEYPKDVNADEALFRKGLEEIRLERDADALASLDRLIARGRKFERLAEVLFWRAALLQRKGDLAEAEKTLFQALKENPSKDVERETYYQLGLLQQQAGRENEAASMFLKLLDDPLRARFTPQQLAWLSEHQYGRKAYAAAEKAARRLVEQAPDDGWRQAAWTLAGRAAQARGSAKDARAAYGSAITVPGNTRYAAEARLRMGELLLEAKETQQAEKLFREAATAASTPDMQSIRIMAQAGLGRALRQRGESDDAARYLLGVCLLYRDDGLMPPLIAETVELLRSLKRVEEAAVLLKDLAELYPNSAEALALSGAEGRAVKDE